jgi:hypothetical protein
LVIICCYTQCEYSEAIAVGTATTRINNPIISQLLLYIELDNATSGKAVVSMEQQQQQQLQQRYHSQVIGRLEM